MLTEELWRRLSGIRVLLVDVDGVMTDGHLQWSKENGWTRRYYIQDGYGLKLLMKQGVQIGVISGGDSADVRERVEFLGLQHVYLGNEDKIIAYEKIKNEVGCSDEQIAYIGDELFDIPVLEKVGVPVSVPAAVVEVKAVCQYITKQEGGKGAIRELVDMIRYARSKKTLDEFLNRDVAPLS